MKTFTTLISFLLVVTAMAVHAQTTPALLLADSLYSNREWASAKMKYADYLLKDSSNSMVWNRMGYCNQNLGYYTEAISNYNEALLHHPQTVVKSSAMFRKAMAYSLMNNPEEAADWAIQATKTGYNSLNDLDSLAAFKNFRASAHFPETRKIIYEIIYPCSREPRNHDFDFWIGDWDCYRTGTKVLSGYSHVEAMAGGCAVLENYTSVQAYSGKSFNYYDTISGKWMQDWIGSGGPGDRQHFYNGEFKNGTMHFQYEIKDQKGEKTKGNFIFYFISRDSVRQYQDVTDDQGKTVSVTYDLTYLRKK
jgi:tetratricopeptide (TPR) repeat protein